MMARLDEDKVSELWGRYKYQGDKAARDRLILAYSPLVKYVAGRMSNGLPSHIEESDLISYGLLGLIGALERFDPDREIKFETYAISRIKGSIIDELRSLDWVPRSVRSKAREIEKVCAILENRLQRAPTDEEIADELQHHRGRVPARRSRRSPTPASSRSTSSGRSPARTATRRRSSTRSRTPRAATPRACSTSAR